MHTSNVKNSLWKLHCASLWFDKSDTSGLASNILLIFSRVAHIQVIFIKLKKLIECRSSLYTSTSDMILFNSGAFKKNKQHYNFTKCLKKCNYFTVI